jgi:UDP-N-acetylglucosamine 2-epimerase (non-hydrolysing)
MYSRFVMTDSGGIQKEASILGIPCLTKGYNEWNITLTHGTDRLVPDTEGFVEEALGY